ncbi:MAG: Cytosol aminopeptidase [Verrucomicrobiae bacterium]|nr:Cytosol aminopeptidase [Verrucomicrobiae bacterium]
MPLVDVISRPSYSPAPMNVTVNAKSAFSQPSPVVVLYAFQNERPALPVALRNLLRRLTTKEFNGTDSQLLLLHSSGKPSRLLLVGLGQRTEFTLEKLRRATGTAIKKLRAAGLDRATVHLNLPTDDALFTVVEAAELALYKFTEFQVETPGEFKTLTICLPAGSDLPVARQIVHRAQVTARAASYARALANLPPNIITPATLADRARQLADEVGLTCQILDKAALKEKNFGGILAVGGGSANEPRLIILEYRGGPADQQPFALVGKAITFDTGGISLKHADRMEDMKFDKCGGCAVLGIMRGVAELQLPVNVLAIIAAAENMPSSTSYRPSDIVTSYRGKDKRAVTIEVINTDAEGRIVLGDAITYARERGAQAIVDFATLTGACVVALGNHAAGLFSNHAGFSETLRAAGERTGERCWPLPLWQEYRDAIKSEVADHKNTGGREGGAITAAAFIEKYAQTTPWIHLDIAGTAYSGKEKPYLAPGATGFGVRLLLHVLGSWRGTV